MTDPFAPRVGGILSADIAVPEHERVVRFYSRVLTTGETPFWREDLMNNRGTPIIGLGPRTEEYSHLPLQWMPHIQVADVGKSADRAVELGGAETLLAKSDNEAYPWAVLRDPNGAAFGLIPVVSPDDLPPASENEGTRDAVAPGCIAWLDLTVADASATRDFYQEVVGWTAEEASMEDAGERYADYCMLGADGNPAAGVCHARGVNGGLPPVWLLYLPVGDLDESLRRVEAEGGQIIKKSTGGDGSCTGAVIQDPVGACLALARG